MKRSEDISIDNKLYFYYREYITYLDDRWAECCKLSVMMMSENENYQIIILSISYGSVFELLNICMTEQEITSDGIRFIGFI